MRKVSVGLKSGMNSFWISLLILSGAVWARANGNGVNNGGDAVLCRASAENSFSGYYSLDFLVQFDPSLLPVKVQTLNASLDRVESALQSKLPELVEDFRDFRRGIFNESDYQLKRLWEKAAFGLIDLKDENLVTALPANCKDGEKVSIVQAVVRQSPEATGRPLDMYVYKFVPEVIEKLSATNPIQLSFLILHEWLWDFSQNVDRNRRVNYWLHSPRLESWTRAEWISNLQSVGFQIPGQTQPAFGFQVCPSDLEATQKMRKLLQTQSQIKFGKGSAQKQTRLCNSEAGCGARASDTSSSFARNFLPLISLESLSGKIVVVSQNPGGHPVGHFDCSLRGDAFSCSPFIIASGYEYEPKLNFELQIGKDCVLFRAQTKERISGRDVQIDDYAILFNEVTL